MYMHLHFAVCDVARQVLEKKAASLADKEKIAKGVVQSQTLPCGMAMTIETSEEEINDMEQRILLVLEYNGWYSTMCILWVGSGEDPTRASMFHSELADCDIRIHWDGDEPSLEYVENPHHSETEYNIYGYSVWDCEGANTNPHKEHWLIDGFLDYQQSFGIYSEDFGIVDENECLEELVQICLDVLENQNFEDDEDEIDEFIVDSLLNCCACEDVRPDGYEFDVEKGPQERCALGFYITIARGGRVLCKSKLIQKKGDAWVETEQQKCQESSRKRKADSEPEDA
jgi:hypothetical protein